MVEISFNTIINNTSTDGGGGISCQDANPTIDNNLIVGNASGLYGGGIYCEFSSPGILNCTIAYNDGGAYGGALACYTQSGPKVTNSIIRGDLPDEIYTDEIFPKVSYSNVQGGYAGLGNIDANPMFVNQSGGDFHLKQAPCQLLPMDAGNPCVDAGDPEYTVIGSTRTDAIKDSGLPDMGYHYPAITVFSPGTGFLEEGGEDKKPELESTPR